MQTKTNYDIIIIGAGVVGLTLALALVKNGLRTLVLDKHLPETDIDNKSIDLRVSAITPASVKIFHALDVWADIQKMRVSPYREMHVWDAGGNGEIHFDSADIGSSTLGYIIENNVLQSVLLKHYQQYEIGHCLNNVMINNIDYLPHAATISLSNDEKYSAAVIVGADGANSTVRNLTEIKTIEWDYGHSALVATVKTKLPHQETAWQRFLSTGPLAFLPLNNPHLCSIVWSALPVEAQRLQQLSVEEFQHELAAAFENRLGDVTLMSKRIAFPVRMRHAKQYVKSRIVLIGDAAHTIHPLAGQGVNLGIMDAACLHEILTNMNAKGRDIGALYNLRRYERRRKGDNMTMLAAMEMFKRFFGMQLPPARRLRNAGLSVTNQIKPLKSIIMQHAMGLTGYLPGLAQGLMPD